MRSFASKLSVSSLLACLTVMPSLYAQQVHRSTQDLSGTWDFQWDRSSVGEREHWEAVTGHPAGWIPLRVPGSPNFQLAAHPDTPELSDINLFYRGAMWFHTSFRCAPDAQQQIMLHLTQVALRHKVWLNGKLVGSSAVPYQDVAYDVSSLLREDSNELVIETDNRVLPRAIPDEKWVGWWDAGGLIGPVLLERRPLAHADTIYTTTLLPDAHWKLVLDTHVQAPQTGARVHYELRDAAGTLIWQTTRAAAAHLQLMQNLGAVKPWSPEHPNLYRLTVTTTTAHTRDVDQLRVGFRQIETRNGQILLNGKRILFLGLNRHQFYPGQGMTLTAAQNRADLVAIKSMGANFVRLTHYSQSQDVYGACDELGLLVWTEIPAWATTAETLGDPSVWSNDAVPQLRAMVAQHRNHPSVVVYSVANEIQSDAPRGAAYVEKAVAFVRSLDSSRLITFASNKMDHDLALGYGDFVAINEYFGWYHGVIDDLGPMLDLLHAKYPGKAIVVSEFGSEAVAGWDPATRRPDNSGNIQDFSLQFQVDFLTRHLDQIFAPGRSAFMAGSVIWVYNDFPDPHRFGGAQPASAQYRNCKGVVTMDRKPKPSFYAVKAYFQKIATGQ